MRAAVRDLAGGIAEPERQQRVDTLIRHAHSLRGAAQIMGLARLAAIAAALEKRLDAAPDDEEAARTSVEAIARIGEHLGLDDARFAPIHDTPADWKPEAVGPVATGQFRVLHVEDGQVNRALVSAIFARASHPRVRDSVLVSAESLAEARAILRSQDIHLVLLDVRLPDGDGLDLARELRNSPGERIPVVVVSASVLPAERLAALAAGGDKFIGKPVDPAELVATVAAIAKARLGPAS